MPKTEIFPMQVGQGIVRMAVGNIFIDFRWEGDLVRGKNRGSLNGSRGGKKNLFATKSMFLRARSQATAILHQQKTVENSPLLLERTEEVGKMIEKISRPRMAQLNLFGAT